MSDTEKLIEKVKNNSTYTRQEREEWISKIRSGDKQAIEAAKKLLKGEKAPDESEIGLSYKRVGNRVVKKGSSSPSKSKKQQEQNKDDKKKEQFRKAVEQHEKNKLSLIQQGSAYTEQILPQQKQDEFKQKVYGGVSDNMILIWDAQETIQQRKSEIKRARQELNDVEQLLESKRDVIPAEQYQKYKEQIGEARANLTKAEVQLTAKEVELRLEKQKMAKEVDTLIQQYEKQKYEYGSDNDLIDYAISAGVGGITGAIAGAVAGGPVGAAAGAAIGATSGIAGQAAGEYVTSKTGNKIYGLAADLGVGFVSGIAEAKAVSTAIRETAEVSSESSMKVLLKEESEDVVKGIAKVDSEVNIKSLGGILKETKEVEGIYDLRTIRKIKEGIKDYGIIQKITGEDEVYDTSLRYITKVDDKIRVGSGHSSSKVIMDYTGSIDEVKQERYAVNEVKAFVESQKMNDKTLIKHIRGNEELGMITIEDEDYVKFMGQGRLDNINHEFKFKGVYKRANGGNIVKYDSVVQSNVDIDKEIKSNIVKNVSSDDVVSLQKQEVKEIRDTISKDVSSLKNVHQSVIEDVAEETLDDITKSIKNIGIVAPVTATGVKTISMNELNALSKSNFKDIEKIDIGKIPNVSEGIGIDIKTITTPDINVGSVEITLQETEQVEINSPSIDIPSVPNIPDIDYTFKPDFDFDFPPSQYISRRKRKRKKRYSEIEYNFGDLW